MPALTLAEIHSGINQSIKQEFSLEKLLGIKINQSNKQQLRASRGILSVRRIRSDPYLHGSVIIASSGFGVSGIRSIEVDQN